jgi:hypothetical protein
LILGNLPSKTKIIAEGSVFNANPGFARRTSMYFAAKNTAYFIRFLLHSEKSNLYLKDNLAA